MKALNTPIIYRTIAALLRGLALPAPLHPLVALVNYDIDAVRKDYAGRSFLIHFYKISFKKAFRGQVRYGQGHYDFEAGGMAFLAPNQLVTMSDEDASYEGYTLYFHPDLIRSYPLGKTISQYGFFSYAVSEALFLSDKEKGVITGLLESIAIELDNNVDGFSQDILVSQIDLLLHHCDRFYHRQFLTRKQLHNDLIDQMDNYLTGLFEVPAQRLPTVQQVAEALGVSPRYLNDMLRSLTGKSTRAHIHDRLIAAAKTLLGTTRLGVAEIAYHFGFEHPQSFNKLFKRATAESPRAYRERFYL